MARPKRASLYRNGGIFYISYWRGAERVRESTGTNNRKIADEIRRQREIAMLTGSAEIQAKVTAALNDPIARGAVLAALETQASVSISTLKDEYLAHAKTFKRPKTVANDMGRLNAFLGSLTVLNVAEVSTRHVNDYIAKKVEKDKSSPATVLRIREILHAFFAFAKAQGYVKSNPVDGVPRPRLPERDIRFLTIEQIGDCLVAVGGDLIEPLIATAIYAGLRRSELCWLTWEDCDLDKRLLRIRNKKVGEDSWITKTKKNRTVPISPALHPSLVALPLPRTGWLFKSPEGCRWDSDNLGHRFEGLMEGAKLPWNFLDLRHTFGSHLAQKGTSLFKIAELMGNSPEIARRHYARLVPENMHGDVDFGAPLRNVAR